MQKALPRGSSVPVRMGRSRPPGSWQRSLKRPFPQLCAGNKGIRPGGAAHRSKRRVGCAVRWVGRCVLYPEAGWAPCSHHLPFLRGSDGETTYGILVPGLHMSTGFSGVCMWKKAEGEAAL